MRLANRLHQLADKWNLSLVQTMLRASQELTAKGDNGVGTGLIIAAYVEDVEGTFRKVNEANSTVLFHGLDR